MLKQISPLLQVRDLAASVAFYGQLDMHGDGVEWEDGMPQMNAMSTNADMAWQLVDADTVAALTAIDDPRLRRQPGQLPDGHRRHGKGRQHRQRGDAAGDRLGQPLAHRRVDEETKERDERNQRQHEVTISRT